MEYYLSDEANILQNFRQKVVEAVNLVEHIPGSQKSSAWTFWEMASRTVHYFTREMITGATYIGMETEIDNFKKNTKQKVGNVKKTYTTKARNRTARKPKQIMKTMLHVIEDENQAKMSHENRCAVDSITETSHDINLTHLITIHGSTEQDNSELTQVILNANDIINQVNNDATDHMDVTQALKNVSAEVEIQDEFMPQALKCRKPSKTSPSKVKTENATISGKPEKKTPGKKGKSVVGKKTGKRNLRVKRIQTEPTEQFPVLKIKKKRRNRPTLTTEQKLRNKYERLRKWKQTKLKREKAKKQNQYEGLHSYSKVEESELGEEAEEEDVDNSQNLDDEKDDNEEFMKFLESEKQKEEARKNRKRALFNADGQIRRKRRSKFDDKPEKENTCSVCGAVLSSLGALDAHMRTHTGNRPFRCEEEGCDKSFTTKGNLKRHQQYHRNERPFECDICQKTFTEAKTLKVHKRTHTGDRPFKCDICGYSFTQSNALKAHMAGKHNFEKTHLCELCGEGFKVKSNLTIHMKRHQQDKTFPCQLCNLTFHTRCEMKKHLTTHTKETSYQCKACPKKFSRLCSYKEHMNYHLGRKPYICEECGERFTEYHSIYRHKIKHKRDQDPASKSQISMLWKNDSIDKENKSISKENDLPDDDIMYFLSSKLNSDEEKEEEDIIIQSIEQQMCGNERTEHIIMTGDNLSSDEIQQIQAIINRETAKFNHLDDGSVQIILNSDQTSFLDDDSPETHDESYLNTKSESKEQEVLIVNTTDNQQVLSIYVPQSTKDK